jgi:hypothetical protein
MDRATRASCQAIQGQGNKNGMSQATGIVARGNKTGCWCQVTMMQSRQRTMRINSKVGCPRQARPDVDGDGRRRHGAVGQHHDASPSSLERCRPQGAGSICTPVSDAKAVRETHGEADATLLWNRQWLRVLPSPRLVSIGSIVGVRRPLLGLKVGIEEVSGVVVGASIRQHVARGWRGDTLTCGRWTSGRGASATVRWQNPAPAARPRVGRVPSAQSPAGPSSRAASSADRLSRRATAGSPGMRAETAGAATAAVVGPEEGHKRAVARPSVTAERLACPRGG